MSIPKVMFVEDEAMIGMVMEVVLTEAGYQVRYAVNGTEALEELERNASDYAVVCTDIKMPGVSGWQVARRARELHPRIGLVYASGDSGANWQEEGLPGSFFLQKPYTMRSWFSQSARRAGLKRPRPLVFPTTPRYLRNSGRPIVV